MPEVPALVPLRESDRNGRAHRVSVAIKVNDHALETEAQARGRRLDDAAVGLMRDQPGEVSDGHMVALQNLLGHFGHAYDGRLEYRWPVLHDIMPSLGN